jgi:peptide/nickel transport system permease protein
MQRVKDFRKRGREARSGRFSWFVKPFMQLVLHPQGLLGGTIVLAVLLSAIFAFVIAPHDPNIINVPMRLQPPSQEHLFGTDHLGRDVFSRVVYGSRASVLAGFVATSIAVVFGTLFGVLAGYIGGRIDSVIMRVTDALLAFPSLVLMIAFAAVFGAGLGWAMVAIGISSIPNFIRLVRGQVLSVRAREYVEASRGLGANHMRITSHHILPNIVAPIIVWASLTVGGAILAESGLSFLGLGTQPPTASWGSMVNQGNQYLRMAPWIAIFPGAAIFLTVIGANLLGDALRDLGDPRMRGRK